MIDLYKLIRDAKCDEASVQSTLHCAGDQELSNVLSAAEKEGAVPGIRRDPPDGPGQIPDINKVQ